ncbi:MAG: transporter [Candidatus Eremiobacteraeota bacterium]|nr:transporter [Candidatus Eremiobacteraeota bacterium]
MHFRRLLFAALVSAALATQPALAIEGPSPFQPGSSTGSPSGALPPPGMYLVLDVEYADGTLRDNNGNKVPVFGWKSAVTPIILIVYKKPVFGATYGWYIVQPLVAEGVDATAVGGGRAVAHGFANTTFSPLNLSWALPPNLHAKLGFAVQPPDGTYLHAGTGAAAHQLPQSPGNYTWTYEPDAAVSWLRGGWNLTAHAVFDFQTRDTVTNYQSGNVFYLDLTAMKTTGKWTVGLVGNVSQQFTDDVQNGARVGSGNRFAHDLLGPVAVVDFGRAGSLKLDALHGFRATNDLNVSFYHIQYATKL